MRKIIGIAVLGMCLAASPVMAGHSSSPSCESIVNGLKGVEEATTLRQVDDAVVKTYSVPANDNDLLEKFFKGDVGAAKKYATDILENAKKAEGCK